MIVLQKILLVTFSTALTWAAPYPKCPADYVLTHQEGYDACVKTTVISTTEENPTCTGVITYHNVCGTTPGPTYRQCPPCNVPSDTRRASSCRYFIDGSMNNANPDPQGTDKCYNDTYYGGGMSPALCARGRMRLVKPGQDKCVVETVQTDTKLVDSLPIAEACPYAGEMKIARDSSGQKDLCIDLATPTPTPRATPSPTPVSETKPTSTPKPTLPAANRGRK